MMHRKTWNSCKVVFPRDDYKAALSFSCWMIRRVLLAGDFAKLTAWLRAQPSFPSRLDLKNKIEELLGEKI